MTAREIYEAVLVEQNKGNAPAFTLEEFNYLLNKAILAHVNERYNFYNINQQLSDDLRVLLESAVFAFDVGVGSNLEIYNKIASRIVSFTRNMDTSDFGTFVSSLADIDRTVIDRVFYAPESTADIELIPLNELADEVTYPYKISAHYPTTESDRRALLGKTLYLKQRLLDYGDDIVTEMTTDRVVPITLPASNYFHILSCRTYWEGRRLNASAINGGTEREKAYLNFPAKRLTYDMLNLIENNVYMRPRYSRPYFMVWENPNNSGVIGNSPITEHGSQNKPLIHVHIGPESTGIKIRKIVIDYLKIPERIVLDEIDIWSQGEDGSQVLEFPDYLKNQFVKRVVDDLLEISADPRLRTHMALGGEIPKVPFEMQQAAKPPQQAPQQRQQAQDNQ